MAQRPTPLRQHLCKAVSLSDIAPSPKLVSSLLKYQKVSRRSSRYRNKVIVGDKKPFDNVS